VSVSPIIVVVGSPNTGKSTLVNRLSASRTAVVHETAGVTRDRKEVPVEWSGRTLTFVDTGGYDSGDENPYAADIRAQVSAAVQGADGVLFVIDGRAGPLADDFAIAEVVRRLDVPVLLVANKLDEPGSEGAAAEAYSLGLGEPVIVSALHGIGTGDLLDRVVAEVGAAPGVSATLAPAAAPEIPVVIVGRPNAGKSSLFNAIVGEPRVIVSEIAGTTRDAIDTAVDTPQGRFRFVDTAGMRKAAKVSGVEYYSYLRSLQSLDRAHVAVVVVDATAGFSGLDVTVADEAARRGCATVLAVNKTDLARPDLESIRGTAAKKLRQRPPVLPVAAKVGWGVTALLEVVALLESRYTAHVATGELNRALAALAAERPLPAKRGKRLKMYYVAQFQTSPPRFAIEVNDRSLVTRDFGYFVENRLRSRFRLEGVPVIIDFKGK
jgi:GTP-binding protein